MIEEFVLPKDWYIIITDDNRKLINNWKIKQTWCSDLFENPGYLLVNDDGSGANTARSDSNKITTEQFKSHVLKLDTIIEKEIIENFDYLIKLFKKLNIQ